jgi:hypothetical protein
MMHWYTNTRVLVSINWFAIIVNIFSILVNRHTMKKLRAKAKVLDDTVEDLRRWTNQIKDVIRYG